MKRTFVFGVIGSVALLLLVLTPLIRAEQSHPLLGKPGPAFSLDLLDGGKMDLADHKGKNIVVLDFWATWCPPCRMAMPTVVEVTGQYKDKGVVFYGVDIAETADAVKEFQHKLHVEFPVVLDTDGAVSEKYRARSIPQTVIIDKEGVVQSVRVGLAPDLKEQLKKDLDALVAGKSLVKPEKKKPEKAKA